MADTPANIREFSTISALIFAQLYKAFPVVEDIDRQGIANAMGVQGNDWATHVLPSGRSFNEMLAHTIGWLNHEGFISAYGAHPAAHVILTTKGFAAMNDMPSGLKASVGTELVKAVANYPAQGINYGVIGDLIGGVFGGFAKSMSGG